MQQRAFTAIIFAAILYGTSGVFIKYMTIPATSIAWIRTAIPGVVMALWMWRSGKRFFSGNFRIMLGASVLNAARMYLFFVAYIYTTIGNAVIMYYTWPVFAAIFSTLILKEQISKRQIILLALAFTGILIAYSNQQFSFDNKDFIGMSASFLSAMLYALSIILFKSESLNYSRYEIIFYQNLVGVLVFTPFFIFNEPKPTALDIQLGISYAALIGLLAYYLFFWGLNYLKASTASMITYIEVVSALIFGYLFFEEILSWNMIIGGVFIVISTAMIRQQKLIKNNS